MSVEHGPRHGRHSRELCLEFLKQNDLSEISYSDVLDTIEHHDRKDYPAGSASNNLLTVLSAADDLDAFGFTGIYRYSEIYLARGISPQKIGNLVLENAGKRFDNFEAIFGRETSYVQMHRKRFEILTGFFTHYNRQAVKYDFASQRIEGYCGIIQLFETMLTKRVSLYDLMYEAQQYNDDLIIESYFIGLKTELSADLHDDEK